MTLDMIVKANDGRGRGHIGRVKNWLDFSKFNTSIGVIVHKGYSDMIPERAWSSLVKDEGFRIDLDKNEIYEKWNNHDRTEKITPEQAVEKYYFSLLDGLTLNEGARLIYVDDQNAPETLFMGKIGKLIDRPAQDIERMSPNANTAFEIETQVWDRQGHGSMGKTRQECFHVADYLHLSTDADFIRRAVGVCDYTGDGNRKVIPMGFPLSNEIRVLFDDIKQNPESKNKIVKNLYEKIGEAESKKPYLYCSFGAGDGAKEVFTELCNAAQIYDKILFISSNPGGKLSEFAADNGFNVMDLSDTVKKIMLKNDKCVYFVSSNPVNHLKLLAAADVLLQGNGSGTTYEGIASQTPIINVPLVRPGYEQLIKGIGVTACGAGELLLLPDVEAQMQSLCKITENYGFTIHTGHHKFDADGIIWSIEKIAHNRKSYLSNLKYIQSYFADPLKTAETIRDMAAGFDAPQIIHRQGLKAYY